MRGFIDVLELILPLKGFDEGFLGEVLGVGDVSYDPVDEQEDTPQVLGNKAVLQFLSGLQSVEFRRCSPVLHCGIKGADCGRHTYKVLTPKQEKRAELSFLSPR